MPGFDGTGPNGQGSFTGRGFGRCQRGFGNGRGRGLGRGRCLLAGITSEEQIDKLEEYKKEIEVEIETLKKEAK